MTRALRLSRHRRAQRGQSLIEVALSLSLLLLIFSGIVDLGRAFMTQIALDSMISEGAHWATAYPGCIAYAQNATSAAQVPPQCQGTNSIIGRMILESKDLDTPRFTALSVTPTTAQAGDQVVLSLTYQMPTVTPLIQSLFGKSFALTVEAKELVRGTTVPDYNGDRVAQPPNISPVPPVGYVSFTCTNGLATLSWAAVQASGYHAWVNISGTPATIPVSANPSWQAPGPGPGNTHVYTITSYNYDPVMNITTDSAARQVTVACPAIQPTIASYSCTLLGVNFDWTMPTPLDLAVQGYRIVNTTTNMVKRDFTGSTTFSGGFNFAANPPEGIQAYAIQALDGSGNAIGQRSAPDQINCQSTIADLSITSISANPDPVVVGSQLAYTITVANAGPTVATNVALTDQLDSSVNFVSAPGCTVSGQNVTCNLASLNPGSTAAFVITVSPQTVKTITNNASVTADQPDLTTPNTASLNTIVTPVPDISISMIGTQNVAVGGTITYQISLQNNLAYPVSNVTVSDTLPAGMAFSQGSNPDWVHNGSTVTHTLPLLGPNASAVVTLSLGVPSGYAGATTVTNNVLLTTGNKTASAQTTIMDVAITNLTANPSSVTAGGSVTYSITVTNEGPGPASNITLIDTYPSGVTFSPGGSNSSWTGGSGTVSYPVGTLASGNSTIVTLVLGVPFNYTGANPFTNQVQLQPDDPSPGNNTAVISTAVLVPNLVITSMNPSSGTVQAGQSITYTINVKNTGTGAASSVTLQDTMPTGFSLSGPTGWTQAGPVVTWNVGALAVNATATVPLVLTVPLNYNVAAQVVDTASVMLTGSTSGNSQSVSTTVTEPPIQSFTGSCAKQGNKYKFTFNWAVYPTLWGVTSFTISSSSLSVTWNNITPGTQTTDSPSSISTSSGSHTFTITAYQNTTVIAASTTTATAICS